MKEVKPKDTRRAVKEAEECFGKPKTKTWGADTWRPISFICRQHGCHGCHEQYDEFTRAGEGPANHIEVNPRSLDTRYKQRSAVTVVKMDPTDPIPPG